MKKETHTYTRSALFLRLLAGGYLVYTAWDLREAVTVNPLYLIAVVIFAITGALLLAHSGRKLCKGEYAGGHGAAKTEESPEDTQQK